MKKTYFASLIILIFNLLFLNIGLAQTINKSSNIVNQLTIQLPDNFCQNYIDNHTTNFSIEITISGLTDNLLADFESKIRISSYVTNVRISSLNESQTRIVKIDLIPSTDFSSIKNIFISSNILNITEEGITYPIAEWTSYNSEQCNKIKLLNENIYSIELKFNIARQEASQNSLLWIEKNKNTLIKVKEAKSIYLESIK